MNPQILYYQKNDYAELKEELRSILPHWYSHSSMNGRPHATNYLDESNPGSIYAKLDNDLQDGMFLTLCDLDTNTILAMSGMYSRNDWMIGAVRMIKNPWLHYSVGFDHTIVMRKQVEIAESVGTKGYVITFNDYNRKLYDFIKHAEPTNAHNETAFLGMSLYKRYVCEDKEIVFNGTKQLIAHIPFKFGFNVYDELNEHR